MGATTVASVIAVQNAHVPRIWNKVSPVHKSKKLVWIAVIVNVANVWPRPTSIKGRLA